jgi:hypothetical protein
MGYLIEKSRLIDAGIRIDFAWYFTAFIDAAQLVDRLGYS